MAEDLPWVVIANVINDSREPYRNARLILPEDFQEHKGRIENEFPSLDVVVSKNIPRGVVILISKKFMEEFLNE